MNGNRRLASLMQGLESHATTCQRCGTTKHTNHSFEELNLYVHRESDLESMLAETFATEILSGEDGYFCDRCQTHTEAQRVTSLAEAPSVLSVQLMRYNFDKASGRKTKVNCSVSFPMSLRILEHNYRLVSAVYHIGYSANGGHYVCDVLDWAGNRWMHCDDATVDELHDDWLADEVRPQGRKRARTESEQKFERFRTVYGIWYVREASIAQTTAQARSTVSPLVEQMVQGICNEAQVRNDMQRNLHLQLQEAARNRREQYAQLQSHLSPRDLLAFRVVPTSFLQRWVSGDDLLGSSCSSVDEDKCALRCPHGHLFPHSERHCKIISAEAFEVIRSDSCEELVVFDESNFYCEACVGTSALEARKLDSELLSTRNILSGIEIDQKCQRSNGQRWLSKAWVTQLRRYLSQLQKLRCVEQHSIAALRVSVFGDGKVNSDLLCEAHNSLCVTVAKRAWSVDKNTWNSVTAAFADAVELLIGDQVCGDCQAETAERNESSKAAKSLHQSLHGDKALRPLVAEARNIMKVPSDIPWPKMFVVESVWMESWRTFMRKKSSMGLPPAGRVNEDLFCVHDKVALPLIVISKFRLVDLPDGVQFSSQHGKSVEFLSEDEWGSIQKSWDGPAANAEGCCREVVLTSHSPGQWACATQVCMECSLARETAAREQDRNFVDANLKIRFRRKPPEFDVSSDAASSGRSTRSSHAAEKSLVVCASHFDTVGLLKLKIYESVHFMDFPPHMQVLQSEAGEELADLSRSLHEYNVLASSTLLVFPAPSSAAEDWSFLEEKVVAEEGFAGTFLCQRAGVVSSDGDGDFSLAVDLSDSS